MQLTRLIIAGLLTLFVSARSEAALIVSIDLDPNTIAIDNALTVSQGSQVTANVVFNLSGLEGLSAYSFSVQYDTDLTLNNLVENLPTDFTAFFPNNSAAGIENYIDGTYTGGGSGPTSLTNFVAATFTFIATAPNGGVILPFIENPGGGFDGFLDNNFVAFTPTFQSATVTVTAAAVPEPLSVACPLVLGLGALVRQRYQKRKARSARRIAFNDEM